MAGPDVDVDDNKERVLKILRRRLSALRLKAIHNPDEVRAPDPEADTEDALIGFGTPEHRKQVEEAAERLL